MSEEIPCSRTISLTYSWASLSTPQASQIGKKWTDLVSQSTITQMTFFFEAERGNPMTMSFDTESHFQVGISNGHKSPTGCQCSALTFWQIKPLLTYPVISFFMHSTKSIASGLCTSWCLLDASSIECCELSPRYSSSTPHFWVCTGNSRITRSHLHALQTQVTSLS